MNTDDPMITAYALGELEGEDRAEVEAAVAADDQLRQAVEQIRSTSAQLASALASEEAAIIPGSESRWSGGPARRSLGEAGEYFPRQNVVSFPRLYYVIGGLAAACFAILIANTRSTLPLSRKAAAPVDNVGGRKTVELSLSPIPTETVTPEAGSALVLTLPNSVNSPAPQPAPVVQPAAAVASNPFVPSDDKDKGFQVMSVGSGARLKLDLADTPVAYSVVNKEFMQTLGITNLVDAGSWATGQTFNSTDNGGPGQAQEGTQRSADQNSNAATAASRYTSIARPVAGERPGSESYATVRPNQFTNVADQPLSTFSIDVDTASYANVRRFLNGGQLPPRDAVRIEELVNYFPYKYAPPTGNVPFATSVEATAAPWDAGHRLVRIGIKGREVNTATRPRANLVFLVDVSGSMDEANKLPLVKDSMRLLLRRLREDDRVAIVFYADGTGVALPSTPASHGAEISNAIDSLQATGSTNGSAGIQLAYDIAQQNFVRGGVNRIILCTDGDFNVGLTSQGDLERMIEERAKSNVYLTVLGFGMGNLKDSTLELLADKGNGNYGYIDSRAEAEKLLVNQISSTLVTIAKDVKIQVEFNPAQVSSYRLIGYENRLLAPQDFNNDKIDAGEIGAGHTVTALYEVVPASSGDAGSLNPLRYQPSPTVAAGALSAIGLAKADDRGPSSARSALDRELLTVNIRYKDPAEEGPSTALGTSPDAAGASKLLEFPFTDTGRAFGAASDDFKFASAVAAFGMALRGDAPQQAGLLDNAIAWADTSTGTDEGGYRHEFVDLARRARAMVR